MNLDLNVRHNNMLYHVDIKRFMDLSLCMKQNVKESGPFPIDLKDNLDQNEFSVFMNYINDLNFKVTQDSVLPLIRSSLVYSCYSIFDQVQAFLCNPAYVNTAVETLIYFGKSSFPMKRLECFVAFNFSYFVKNMNFTKVAPSVIYRILTWYSAPILMTQDILDLFFSLVTIHGPSATPLFLLLDYSKLPPAVLTKILTFPNIDKDTVSPLIMRYINNADEERAKIQEIITMKTSQNEASVAERDRLRSTIVKADSQVRISKQKLAELEAKKTQLLQEINSVTAVCNEIQRSINQAKTETTNMINEKEKCNNEKKAVQSETDEISEVIVALKQQIVDIELAKQAEFAAMELSRKAEEEKKRREEEEKKKAEEEAKKLEEEKEREQKQALLQDKRPKYEAQKLYPITFQEEEFKKKFISNESIKVDFSIPPPLKYALDSQGYLRVCELEYLWHGTETADPKSLSNYGAHLILTDKSANDFGISLILQAAEKNDPYALYNAASLILNKVIRGSRESAAKYLSSAAKLGEPDATKLISSLVQTKSAKTYVVY